MQHVDHADHTVHRRADLVAHGGEEHRFGAVGLFGLAPGTLQIDGAGDHFLFQVLVEAAQVLRRRLTLGDVAVYRGIACHITHPVFHR